jgi:hypothetical protein
LVIVLSSVFFFWSLQKKTEDNTMTKRKRQKTIQRPKEKNRRQYKDQDKKTEDNTMTKRKRQKTIQ